jgi:hypothetical protein
MAGQYTGGAGREQLQVGRKFMARASKTDDVTASEPGHAVGQDAFCIKPEGFRTSPAAPFYFAGSADFFISADLGAVPHSLRATAPFNQNQNTEHQ